MNLFERFKTGKSLSARLFRGAAWFMAGNGIEHGLRFARNMILTRILAPEVLGLMALVLMVKSIFLVLTGIGIREAMIQHPRAQDRTCLNSAWWLSTARGALLYVTVFIAAPFIATFYEEPDLCLLLRVAFLGPLVNSMLSPRAYVALKEMRYGRWVLMAQGGGIIGVLTAIVLSLMWRNVWALVVGLVVESAGHTVLSYIMCPYRPGVRMNRDDFRDLFRYTRGMIGLPVLTLIYTQADVFVVGKLCSKHDLGLYAMALSLARMPSLILGTFMHSLLMPAFAETQGDRARTNRGLLRITMMLALAGTPALLFIMLYGREVLTIIYGQAYAAVALPFAVLFANYLALQCNVPMVSVYLAMGRPDLQRRFALLRALLLGVLIYPAARRFGLAGAATAPLIAMLISYVFQLQRMRDVTGLNIGQYAGVILKASAAALPVAVAWLATRWLGADGAWARILPPALVCAAIYGGLLWWAARSPKARRFIWPDHSGEAGA